jgi:O-antigen ligase
MLLAGGVAFLLRLNWKRIKPAYIFTIVLLFAGLVIFYNSFLDNSEIIEPIENKIEHITRGDLKEDGRIELAAVSLNTFSEHPFFGVGVPDWGSHTQIGEHMPWIDFLAHYGFFGFLPVLLFLILLFKRNYRFYLKSPKNNIYATACLIGFVIFILSNVIDPLIFDAPMIIMLLFFYTSIFNWSNKSTANPFLS